MSRRGGGAGGFGANGTSTAGGNGGAGYQSGITAGWLTRNEVRALESLNPIEGLEAPLQPLNAAPIGSEPTAPTLPAEAEDEGERWHKLLAATWLRILKRYRNDYAGAAKANRLTALVLEVRKYGIEQFEPIAAAMKRDDAAAMFDRGWPGPPDSVPLPDSWGVSTSVEALAWQCGMASVGV